MPDGGSRDNDNDYDCDGDYDYDDYDGDYDYDGKYIYFDSFYSQNRNLIKNFSAKFPSNHIQKL